MKKSPRGLTMIRVPAGESRVTLTFAAPLKLTLSYWVSLGAIFAMLMACVVLWWREVPRSAAASV